MQIFIILLVAISIMLMLYGAYGIKNEIPEDNREYKDPLKGPIKLIWPFVLFFTHYLSRLISIDQLEKISTRLKRAGLDYLISPEQFFGLQCCSGFIVASLAAFALYSLECFGVVYVLLFAAIGFYFPALYVQESRKKREKEIVKMLPVYLDFFTMAVQAGMNLSGAIAQAVDKGPKSILNNELQRVQRDMKAGMSRVESLRVMADRLDIKELIAFVSSVAQAEKTGASVGETLRVQADQRRIERFQRAEKLAMEAPVKLIFPLVAFIFPMTFLVIGFPIAMKFMYEI